MAVELWQNYGMPKSVNKGSLDPSRSDADRRAVETLENRPPVKSFMDELKAYISRGRRKGGNASRADGPKAARKRF
jgi:hypothetical protein